MIKKILPAIICFAIIGWIVFADTNIDVTTGTLNNSNIQQWLEVSLPCSPASVSNGTVNSTTCTITCNAGYDKSWNSCVLRQSSWWGGGGWSFAPSCTLSKLICTDWKYVLKNWVSCEGWKLGDSCTVSSWTWGSSSGWSWGLSSSIGDIGWSTFSTEFNNAYQFAFKNGITTIDNIEEADMTWTLIRSHMAKMMVNYAVKVLNKKVLNTGATCNFTDIEWQTDEIKGYIKLSCQLGIMWIWINEFRPNDTVTRGEFGTVLSRALWGGQYNNDWEYYYIDHLNALRESGIITNTDPILAELRWYVMLMLMRSQN